VTTPFVVAPPTDALAPGEIAIRAQDDRYVFVSTVDDDGAPVADLHLVAVGRHLVIAKAPDVEWRYRWVSEAIDIAETWVCPVALVSRAGTLSFGEAVDVDLDADPVYPPDAVSNPLTTSRQALAAVLEPIGVTVYAAPPSSITTPAVVLGAGTPWAVPVTWSRTAVHWLVTIAAGQLSEGEAAYQRLEGLVWQIMFAVKGEGMGAGDVSSPRTVRYGQAEVAACDLEVIVHVDD
jgi:hypothetical protein